MAPKPAHIRRLKAGKFYLTPTGVAAQFVGQADSHVIMRSVATNTRFVLPASYPLRASGGQEANVGATGGLCGGSGPASAAKRPPPLTPIIDALLLEGGMTMKGLVREVMRRAGAACRGKNVKAGVRARIYWLQKRGMTLCRGVDGRLQVR